MVVAVNGASLVPNITGNLARGIQLGGALNQQQRNEQARSLAGQLLGSRTSDQRPIQGQISGPSDSDAPPQNRDQRLAQLFALDPTLGNTVFNQIGIREAADKQDAAFRAFEIMQTPLEERAGVIQRQADQIRARGGNPNDTLTLLNLPPERQEEALSLIQLSALSPDQRQKILQGEPLTNVVEAEGGGFIGLRGDRAVFVEPPAQRREQAEPIRTAAQAEKEAEKVLKDTDTRFERSSKLRNELFRSTKTFDDIRNSFSRIEAVAENPSAAGDLALIFNFMKMLDPGSVVREGEFANAQNAAGVPNRVRAFYNRLTRGERLTTTQRDDFLSQAERLAKTTEKDREKITDRLVKIAERFDIPREDIVSNLDNSPSGPISDRDASSFSDSELLQQLGL